MNVAATRRETKGLAFLVSAREAAFLFMQQVELLK